MVLVASSIVSISSATDAQTAFQGDGQWWQGLPYSAKIFVVQGMSLGFDLVGSYYKSKLTEKLGQKVAASFVLPELGGLSFGTYVDRIDALYRDYPDLKALSVGLFTVCIFSRGGDCTGEISVMRRTIHQGQ